MVSFASGDDRMPNSGTSLPMPFEKNIPNARSREYDHVSMIMWI